MLLIAGDSITAGHIGIAFTSYLPIEDLMIRGIDGDTMRGVTARVLRYLSNTRIQRSVDALLIECGGNDILLPSFSADPFAAALIQRGKEPIADAQQFIREYSAALDAILEIWTGLGKDPTKIAVASIPPLGEYRDGPMQLTRSLYNGLIREAATQRSFTFIDLSFEQLLSGSPGYCLDDLMAMSSDALLVGKDPQKAEQLSRSRGLHFTIDGVHFNERGARAAAEACSSFLDAL